jgi:hypothetical protein
VERQGLRAELPRRSVLERPHLRLPAWPRVERPGLHTELHGRSGLEWPHLRLPARP